MLPSEIIWILAPSQPMVLPHSLITKMLQSAEEQWAIGRRRPMGSVQKNTNRQMRVKVTGHPVSDRRNMMGVAL